MPSPITVLGSLHQASDQTAEVYRNRAFVALKTLDRILVLRSQLLGVLGDLHPPAGTDTTVALQHYRDTNLFSVWYVWNTMEQIAVLLEMGDKDDRE